VKRLFRSRFQLELSETSLGHARLCDLLQDDRFSDVCRVKFQTNGYVVTPVRSAQEGSATSEQASLPQGEVEDLDVVHTFIHFAERAASKRSRSVPKDHRVQELCLGTDLALESTNLGTEDPPRPQPIETEDLDSQPMYIFPTPSPRYTPEPRNLLRLDCQSLIDQVVSGSWDEPRSQCFSTAPMKTGGATVVHQSFRDLCCFEAAPLPATIWENSDEINSSRCTSDASLFDYSKLPEVWRSPGASPMPASCCIRSSAPMLPEALAPSGCEMELPDEPIIQQLFSSQLVLAGSW